MKRLGIVVAVLAVMMIVTITFFVRDSDAKVLTDVEVKRIVSEQYPGEIKELSFDSATASYKVKVESGVQVYEVFVDSESGEVQSIERIGTTKVAEAKQVEEPESQEQQHSNSDEEVTDQEQTSSSEKADDNVNKQQDASNTDVKKELDSSNAKPEANKQEPSKVDTEAKKQEPAKTAPEPKSEQSSPKPKKALLSHAEVKKIALNEFQGTVTDLELEEDDGRMLYEVEIENNDDEATIEIDAYTGQIIMVEIDLDDD